MIFLERGVPMHKLLIATAAVALATVGTASAADLPMKAPPMVAAAPVASWTGCYISGGLGYGMWNQDNHVTSTVPPIISSTDQTAGGRRRPVPGGGGRGLPDAPRPAHG